MSKELLVVMKQVLTHWADEELTLEQAIEQILLLLRQYEVRLLKLEAMARRSGRR